MSIIMVKHSHEDYNYAADWDPQPHSAFYFEITWELIYGKYQWQKFMQQWAVTKISVKSTTTNRHSVTQFWGMNLELCRFFSDKMNLPVILSYARWARTCVPYHVCYCDSAFLYGVDCSSSTLIAKVKGYSKNREREQAHYVVCMATPTCGIHPAPNKTLN